MKISHVIFLSTLVVLTACNSGPVENPDPNHTHADFAVWIDGRQLDFSGEDYMSGTSDESDPDHTKHDLYLHLHDGNGKVIHRHKPGLTVADFFATLDVRFSENCYSSDADSEVCSDAPFRLFVNGSERPFDGLNYVFEDTDRILITNATDDADVAAEKSALTDDACLYSRTCPERGDPPAENCIADPTVPCVGK